MSRHVEEDDPLVGTLVADKYRIDRLLGRGGMGAVYEATNVGIGKRIALKFLDRDATRHGDAVTRFQREAQAASAVESAHIVHIFDAGVSEDGRPFLVMERLTGEDLRSMLKREGRLDVPAAVHIVGQALRGLSRAHAAGIVHRDLKPDNVFVCRRDDDPMFVKLVDFGISKITRNESSADTLTRRGTVLGTAFYMSPEQAQAFPDIDGRTDLFSAGAILFESLAGRPPHVGSVYEAVLIEICTKDAPDVRDFAPKVPEAIAQVIKKALARDRDERFADANEMYDALALAAPGFLRTSGRGFPTAPIVPQTANATTPSDDGRVATAGGTAVQSRAMARTQLRRGVVVAIVAAAAAFALTVLVTHNPNPSNEATPGAGSTASAEPVNAPPRASVVVAPRASAEEPDAAVEPEASAKPAATHHGLPPRATSTRPTPSAPAPTESAKKPPAGVATGLTLDTRPP